MDIIKDFLPFLALAVSLVTMFMNRRKTGAEVENLKAGTDDKRFGTLKGEIEALKEIVKDRGTRIEQIEKSSTTEIQRLEKELDYERKLCSKEMKKMSDDWDLTFKAQSQRIKELEEKSKM